MTGNIDLGSEEVREVEGICLVLAESRESETKGWLSAHSHSVQGPLLSEISWCASGQQKQGTNSTSPEDLNSVLFGLPESTMIVPFLETF